MTGKQRRGGLGRGLGALIPEAQRAEQGAAGSVGSQSSVGVIGSERPGDARGGQSPAGADNELLSE